MKLKSFNDVKFCKQYPCGSIAEHEVFMSFVNDEDAVSFREWWNEEGSEKFNSWLEKIKI